MCVTYKITTQFTLKNTRNIFLATAHKCFQTRYPLTPLVLNQYQKIFLTPLVLKRYYKNTFQHRWFQRFKVSSTKYPSTPLVLRQHRKPS